MKLLWCCAIIVVTQRKIYICNIIERIYHTFDYSSRSCYAGRATMANRTKQDEIKTYTHEHIFRVVQSSAATAGTLNRKTEE